MGRLRTDAARTDAFDFDLPRDRIAARPARPRDAARMLEVGDRFVDRSVRDLPALLRPGDIVVLNDTRVIPARLRGTRRGAKVEVTLHRAEADGQWRAFARPARRLRDGDVVEFAGVFRARVTAKGGGEVTLAFDRPDSLFANLERYGEMPLPPYLSRPANAADAADYQTVYAVRDGAVAAPTAGLHFTEALLEGVRAAGAHLAKVTLHVGAGTFLPVRVERVADHRMHSEWGEIDAAAAEAVNAARAEGGHVVSVGTTPLRLLETSAPGRSMRW